MAMNDSAERIKARKFENQKQKGKHNHNHVPQCACGERLRRDEEEQGICSVCLDKELHPS
jgi:ABC-type nickel/cobalt efflux system permease component RcnA